MSNTANNSLIKVQKAEEEAAKMIAQAQKARDEKVMNKQISLQKEYTEAEETSKETAANEVSRHKDEVSDKGRQMMHDAKKEAEQLKDSLDSKINTATKKGISILRKSLSL